VADSYLCRVCSKVISATKNNRYRTHINSRGEKCRMGSEPIPEDLLAQGPNDPQAPADVPEEGKDFATCPACGKKVKLTHLGYFMPHATTLYGGDRCPKGGTRLNYPARAGLGEGHVLKKVEDVPLPGDELPKAGATTPARSDSSQPAANRGLAITAAPTARTHGVRVGVGVTTTEATPTPPESPEPTPPADTPPPSETVGPEDSPASTTTSTPSEEPENEPSKEGPYSLGTSYSVQFLQPYSPFLQPGAIPPRLKVSESMSERGKEIAARLRETFYAYNNRNSSDNRSAQKTLGPSEAGSPCDRQIAMKLLGIKPTNPQEGWAPFIGTAVHVELAKMFEWANGSGSGRYVTEMPLTFGSAVVPRGTSDLLDRVLLMILDHKLLGSWSLNKLIQEGPSETYRIQGQIYALGAVLAGEKVREVAIIGWPRQESSLDKLYVHVEPFDRKVAEAALQRVERIARKVGSHNTDAGLDIQAHGLRVAKEFPAGDDCKWCPFHLKGDKGFTRGCPGK